MRTRGRRVACAAVSALVLLGGCSLGDDEPDGEALDPPSAPTTAEPTTQASTTPPATAAAAGTVEPTPPPSVPPAAAPPPPGEGDLQPAPTQTRPTLDPVQLDDAAEPGDDLTVRLTDLQQVQVTGQGPGERSGAAVAVDVEVVNDRRTPLDVAGLAVSLAYDDTEASPVSGPPADEVVGPVPAGSSVSGTYVFLVPEDHRSDVLVRVGLGSSQPVVIFQGRVTN